MEKIELEICLGTACFVMGANQLQDIEERFPEDWKDKVDVKAQSCLELCSNDEYSKAPFVKIDGDVMSEATVEKIMDVLSQKIEKQGI